MFKKSSNKSKSRKHYLFNKTKNVFFLCIPYTRIGVWVSVYDVLFFLFFLLVGITLSSIYLAKLAWQ